MSDAQRSRRRVIVRGRVQGVYFRGSTAERARAAGVAGWVRNLRDGAVEAVFEGDAPAVEELVRYCRHGPSYARVEQVEVFEELAEGLDAFWIR